MKFIVWLIDWRPVDWFKWFYRSSVFKMICEVFECDGKMFKEQMDKIKVRSYGINEGSFFFLPYFHFLVSTENRRFTINIFFAGARKAWWWFFHSVKIKNVKCSPDWYHRTFELVLWRVWQEFWLTQENCEQNPLIMAVYEIGRIQTISVDCVWDKALNQDCRSPLKWFFNLSTNLFLWKFLKSPPLWCKCVFSDFRI